MVRAELHERAVQEGVVVLESVCLVHDERGPSHTTQEVLILEQNLVGGHQDVELQLPVRVAPLVLTDLE